MKLTTFLSPDITRALKLQMRVIFALVLRETRTTFGTSALGYLWAILIPAASIGILVLVFGAFGRSAPYGEHLAIFIALGLLTMEFYKKLEGSLMVAFRANRALLSYPPIKEIDTLIARAILISATYIMIFSVTFMGLYIFDLASIPAHGDVLFQAFLVIIFFGFSMGIFNAVVSSLWDSWTRIHTLINKPLFFVSAIFYVPSYLPTAAIDVLKWNPVLHLVEWMREGYYPAYNSTILMKQYPLSFALLLIVFGLLGERLWRRKRI